MRGSKASPESKDFDTLVGQRIELTRQAMGISGARLAEEVGIGRTTLYYLECGRHSCSPQLLSLIAAALGVSVSALVPKIKVCERSL